VIAVYEELMCNHVGGGSENEPLPPWVEKGATLILPKLCLMLTDFRDSLPQAAVDLHF